jgi:hypothetical protein
MLSDEQIKTVMLMYDLENALGDLYEILSETFPECNNLWHVLILEEREHAEAVRNFYRIYYEGESVFSLGAVRAEAISSILDHVKDICVRAKNKAFGVEQALNTSYDLEGSFIAKSTFNYIGASEAFSELLSRLRDDSEKHAGLVKAELEKLRKTG